MEPKPNPRGVARPNAERRRPVRRPAMLWGIAALALALALPAIAATAGATATAAPHPGLAAGAAPRTAMVSATGPTQSWAWGVAANLSASVQLVGEFNASSAIGANATHGLAYGALDLSIGEQYLAYEIVNLTATSNTSLYVTAEAVDYRAIQLSVALSGTFPAAGTYNNSSAIPLVQVNSSLKLSEAVLDAYAAFLNLTTGPNGSVALVNEHVEALRAFNISGTLVNFPNATTNAAGDEVIAYTTASIAASGWITTNVSASFSPPLVLAPGPLSVGTSWTTNSTAAFVGTTAYAATYAVAVPGVGAVSWSASATASANATVPVSMSCTVVGDQTVGTLGGGTEQDAVVQCTNLGGSAAAPIANGLAVLPVQALGQSAGGNHAPESSAPAASALAVPTRTLYSPSHHLPDAAQTKANSGSMVTAGQMTPAAAQGSIHALSSPTMPDVSGAHASNGNGLLTAYFLLASVAGMIVLGREALRRRK